MAALRNSLSNHCYFAAGIGFLLAAKVKHFISGYKNPRPFSESDAERAILHDQRVVADWKEHLQRWSGGEQFVEGADVLELGPGGDLGIPLLLLAQYGAHSYSALDVHSLALSPRPEFYRELRRRILADAADRSDPVAQAMDAVTLSQDGRRNALLNYQVRDDFDLVRAFHPAKFSVFLSNAAFEHFDSPMRVLEQMTDLATHDARLCFGIDFKTHSIWIRDKDPLNIYRYSPGLYKRLTYRGSPNRYLLSEYLEKLEQLGWKDVTAFRDYIAPDFDSTIEHLHERYRVTDAQYTWVMICARRSGYSPSAYSSTRN